MSWLIRTGALRRVVEKADRDPTIRKADAPARTRTADEIAADLDIAISGLGGTRTANMDWRAQQLAKMEATERHQAAVRQASEDRDAERGMKPLVLPSEERKRKAAKARQAASNKDDEDDGSTPPPAAAPVKDTKVKPGTSNVTHKPSGEGVYAPRDGRTVTTHHTVNRKLAATRAAIKSDRVGRSLDLTDPRT